MRIRSFLAASLIAAPGLVLAEDSPSTKALKQANDAMMVEMMAPTVYTGDADRDFVTMMIPHHQGAIDMAKVVLEYGKDPEVRALAEAIVKSQSEEVAWMKDWLARQPK